MIAELDKWMSDLGLPPETPNSLEQDLAAVGSWTDSRAQPKALSNRASEPISSKRPKELSHSQAILNTPPVIANDHILALSGAWDVIIKQASDFGTSSSSSSLSPPGLLPATSLHWLDQASQEPKNLPEARHILRTLRSVATTASQAWLAAHEDVSMRGTVIDWPGKNDDQGQIATILLHSRMRRSDWAALATVVGVLGIIGTKSLRLIHRLESSKSVIGPNPMTVWGILNIDAQSLWDQSFQNASNVSDLLLQAAYATSAAPGYQLAALVSQRGSLHTSRPGSSNSPRSGPSRTPSRGGKRYSSPVSRRNASGYTNRSPQVPKKPYTRAATMRRLERQRNRGEPLYRCTFCAAGDIEIEICCIQYATVNVENIRNVS